MAAVLGQYLPLTATSFPCSAPELICSATFASDYRAALASARSPTAIAVYICACSS